MLDLFSPVNQFSNHMTLYAGCIANDMTKEDLLYNSSGETPDERRRDEPSARGLYAFLSFPIVAFELE